MKFKTSLFLMAGLGLLGLSCNRYDGQESDEVKSISFKIDNMASVDDDDVETRTSLDASDNYIWAAGDTIGIYPNTGSQVYFVTEVGVDAGYANFNGGGWAFKSGSTYSCYYPFQDDFHLDRERIPVTFLGQKQPGTTSISHMGKYHYLYTKPTSAASGALNFTFKHLCCIIRPKLTLPAGTYTKLAITAPSNVFVTEGYYDLTSDSPVIVGEAFTNRLEIELEDITLTEQTTFRVYLMSAPVDLKGVEITVSVWDADGNEFQCKKTPSAAYNAGTKAGLTCSSWSEASLTLDKTAATLKVGETVTLTATVKPDDATDKTVRWKSSNWNVAVPTDSLGTTSRIFAKKIGSSTITAKAGDKTATCEITVEATPVTSVSLNQTFVRLKVGETKTLTAAVQPNDATNKTVTWSTSDATVATVDNGIVTAKKVGTAEIIAKSGDVSATCTVMVKETPVTSVTLDKTTATLKAGETVTLTAVVKPDDATDKTVTWSTSDVSVASVDNGVVTAKTWGTATITAKSGDMTDMCTVTVLDGVKLDKTEYTLLIGGTVTLTATVISDDATDKTVTWSTSDATIVTVDNGVVSAKNVGTATITAKSGDLSATCEITVNSNIAGGHEGINEEDW